VWLVKRVPLHIEPQAWFSRPDKHEDNIDDWDALALENVEVAFFAFANACDVCNSLILCIACFQLELKENQEKKEKRVGKGANSKKKK
jgi:hypothetical protein